MLFHSFAFIALVIITLFIYYFPIFSKYQVHILIIASLIFYSWQRPILVLLLLTSASINIITSFYIAHSKKINKKIVAWLGVASNLTILGIFKYAGLISTAFPKDSSIGDYLLNIPLPIGISFFTFQGISLVVDVYKEKHFNNQKIIPESILEHSKNTLFFITFFPQLVAGPIVKAHDFLPQIQLKKLSNINWESCFRKITLGYFLKMVVADNLKDFTFWIAFPYFQSKDTLSLITMLFGFSCQIYADFAGYSLIAIGIAELFGYKLKENFNLPYISSSFREFWKRWHISLSTFLQEYLYIPLGGNRKGKLRTYMNLMITMILGGLWHGAGWSYAVWGGFHGIALATERFIAHKIKLKETFILTALKTIFVFSMVSFAWLLFKLPDFDQVILYLGSIKNNINHGIDKSLIVYILLYSLPVILQHLYYICTRKSGNTAKKYEFVIYGFLLFLIITNSGTPGNFVYFQF